jgi:signal transduction histidine kinase
MTPSTPQELDLGPELDLPAGSVALGPPGWRAGAVSGRSTPVAGARRELAPAPAGETDAATRRDGVPPFVLLHGAWLLGADAPEDAGSVLAGLRRTHPAHLPILVGGEIAPQRLLELGEQGLFGVLQPPVEPAQWRSLRERARTVGTRRTVGTSLRSASRGLLRHLARRQRELRGEADEVAADLVRAQRLLEDANSELNDHMAQLALLYRFGRELSSARNWDAPLENLLRSLTEFVGAAGAALVLRAAPGGRLSARRSYRWDERSWDRVLLTLQGQVDADVAEGMLAPGVFGVDAGVAASAEAGDRRIIALPLEHRDLRLGYLLLLRPAQDAGDRDPARYLPFLQTVQVVLSEEVAGAQMLDRMRSIGAFNARVLESVSSGIWVVDGDGETLYCNPAGRELLTGRPAPADPEVADVFTIGRGRWRRGDEEIGGPGGEEVAGPPLAEQEGDLPELIRDGCLRLAGSQADTFGLLLANADGSHAGEGSIVRRDGESIPVRIQTATMPGRQSDERWLVVVADDLRAARRAEAERRRADRLESLVELSAGLAHEIRNPLMGLSAQAELLAEHLPGDDARRRYIDMITTEVGRIDGTITRLLSFVRPYEPRLAPAVLPELLADCVELVRPRAEQRDVGLACHCDDEPQTVAPIPVDAAQIKQVVINLLINALDASPEGGAVDLELSRRSGILVHDPRSGAEQRVPGVVVAVRDDGPGVPAQVREKIFRPFFSTKSAGTGLGLAISHKIVTAHGGDIEVTREDGRTVFRVLLPRKAQAAGERRQEA